MHSLKYFQNWLFMRKEVDLTRLLEFKDTRECFCLFTRNLARASLTYIPLGTKITFIL